MYDVFSELATDENLEINGSWFNLSGKSRVLVARAGNKEFQKALNKQIETNQVALDAGGDAADELSDKIFVDVMSRTILLGWEHMGFKGQALGYTHDNAKLLLGVKDFRKKIAGFSNQFDAYKVKQEAEQGNA